MEQEELEMLLQVRLEVWLVKNYKKHLRLANSLQNKRRCKKFSCADDALQDAYVYLYDNGIGNFRGESSFDSYFFLLLRAGVTKTCRNCLQSKPNKIAYEADRLNDGKGSDDDYERDSDDESVAPPITRGRTNSLIDVSDDETRNLLELALDCLREALEKEREDRDTDAKGGTVPSGWHFLQIWAHELTGREVVIWLAGAKSGVRQFVPHGTGDVIAILGRLNPDLLVHIDGADSARRALENTTMRLISSCEPSNENAPNQAINSKNKFIAKYLKPALEKKTLTFVSNQKPVRDKEDNHVA